MSLIYWCYIIIIIIIIITVIKWTEGTISIRWGSRSDKYIIRHER